jgi:hypothetical protein
MRESGTRSRREKAVILNEMLRVRGKTKESEPLKRPFKKQIQSDGNCFTYTPYIAK